MTLGLAFWILMLIWIVVSGLMHFSVIGGVYASGVNVVLLFLLFVLLGWQVFGAPLHR